MRHGSIYEVMNNFKDAKQGYSHADTHMAFGRSVYEPMMNYKKPKKLTDIYSKKAAAASDITLTIFTYLRERAFLTI